MSASIRGRLRANNIAFPRAQASLDADPASVPCKDKLENEPSGISQIRFFRGFIFVFVLDIVIALSAYLIWKFL